MKNADARYRYYNYFDPNEPIRIAYSDDIRSAFFKDVLSFGISQIIKELNIPYDIEANGSAIWIFNGNDEDFKITWQFDGQTPFSLKISYYENDDQLDIQVLYDYTTYEEALDFIQAYITRILDEGVPQPPAVEYNADDVTELKLMHGVMQSMNNEDAYFSWIIGNVPDGATEDDFIDIASNPDELEECRQSFDNLFTHYAPDGLFRPTSEELNFANKTCKRLGLPAIEVF